MMARRNDADGRDVLENVAESLAPDADAFRPDVESARESLPGRRRGESLAEADDVPRGAAAIVLDVGTSRREGFSHVLWISPSAESLLGSAAFERLGDALGSVNGVSAYEWEGLDHLHVRATERDHAALLAEARDAVERLLA